MRTRRRTERQGPPPRSTAPRAKRRASDADLLRRRSLGNRVLQATREARPRIRVRAFTVPGPGGAGGPAPIDKRPIDKGVVPDTEMQDQSASLNSFSTESSGIGIVVDVAQGESSPDYPDGLRWTQTIDTNVPLGGTTSPYVDPRPNDDTKPFYWTDAEYAARPTQFEDHPSRPTPSSGTTTWRAVLSLNGVDGTTVTRFDSIAYGFDIDSAGAVTGVSPASAGAGAASTHQSTLSSEFSSWTFN